MRHHLWLGAIVLLLATGCMGPSADSAQGVAEGFLDEHYVRIDQQRSLAYCTGLAKHKVEEEIRLIGDEKIDDSTMKPSVSYSLLEEVPEGADRTTFLYAGKVRLQGGDTFEMRWMIHTRREGGAWKVSNYKELPASG